MKEVNIYIKESCDAFTTNGYYDALLTTHGKELRFSKSFSNTSHYRLIIQGAIDAIEKLNQSCIINLYTTAHFGMRRIRHSDGTWRTELGHSVNMDLLLELRDLIQNGGHKLNNIYDKELVNIKLGVENTQLSANGILTNFQQNVPQEISYYNQSNHDKMEDCPFCNLGSNYDMIYQTITCAAFYIADSVSPGHALIIPKRHVVSFFDLTKKEREAIDTMLMLVKKIIDGHFHPDGYNVGFEFNEVAGQSVPHVHIHIIPRYKEYVEIPQNGIKKVISDKSDDNKDDGILDDLLESDTENKSRQEETKIYDDSLRCATFTERQKAYTLEQKREEYGNAYLPWDDEADALLVRMYEEEGKSVKLLSEIFERAPGAIRSRLKKLGKIE